MKCRAHLLLSRGCEDRDGSLLCGGSDSWPLSLPAAHMYGIHSSPSGPSVTNNINTLQEPKPYLTTTQLYYNST